MKKKKKKKYRRTEKGVFRLDNTPCKETSFKETNMKEVT